MHPKLTKAIDLVTELCAEFGADAILAQLQAEEPDPKFDKALEQLRIIHDRGQEQGVIEGIMASAERASRIAKAYTELETTGDD